jgi:CubicO group peptidase (beta-lactamase class C family)
MLSLCAAFAHAEAPPSCPAPPDSVRPNEVPGVDVPAAQIDAAVARVDELARALMASSRVPGMAVAVVHNGQTVFAKGYGVRRLGINGAVDADTVFQLASVSKSIGATVVAHQVGQGVATWDTPVHRLMPTFKLSDAYVTEHVTIADLYAHRSGLHEHAADLLEDLGYSREQTFERMRYLPLASFRDTYAYTNFGLTAAAEAVAIASGSDWATLSHDAIYAPLGMNSTSSRYVDFVARANRAVGHVRSGNGFAVSIPGRQPDTQSPAGGISSSVNDMARWMHMVLGQGSVSGHVFVERCSLLAAVSPQIVSGPPARAQERASFYGLGFNVGDSAAGRVVLTHSGAFALGAATAFTLIPSLDVGIVTLTNAEPLGVPETLNAEFADLVQFGRLTQDWKTLYAEAFKTLVHATGSLVGIPPPAQPAPPRALAGYRGTYQNTYYGNAQVDVVDGRLMLLLGPARLQLPLRHWDGDVFVFTPPGESAPQGSISKATFGDDDLAIEYLNEDFPATFVKRGGTNSRR